MSILKEVLELFFERNDIYEITLKTGLSLQNIENLYPRIYFNRIPKITKTEDLTFKL